MNRPRALLSSARVARTPRVTSGYSGVNKFRRSRRNDRQSAPSIPLPSVKFLLAEIIARPLLSFSLSLSLSSLTFYASRNKMEGISRACRSDSTVKMFMRRADAIIFAFVEPEESVVVLIKI